MKMKTQTPQSNSPEHVAAVASYVRRLRRQRDMYRIAARELADELRHDRQRRGACRWCGAAVNLDPDGGCVACRKER